MMYVTANPNSQWVTLTSASTSTTTGTYTSGGTGSTFYVVNDPNDDLQVSGADWDAIYRDARNIFIRDSDERTIHMPDGSKIEVAKDGSYKIEDKDATVIYRANRIRNFNSYINVSDKLEEFIEFCGKHGVRQGEMLQLPIKLFIGWLVTKAAEADQEPVPQVPLLPDLRAHAKPRCLCCGRFTKLLMKAKRIEFCAPNCFSRYYARAVT